MDPQLTAIEPIDSKAAQSRLQLVREALIRRFETIRRTTEELCAPLAPEDFILQSMPDASPVKWHLAHTSWFYETFVLTEHIPDYQPFHPQYGFLFNSYYNAVGPRWPRPQRGLLSRPPITEIYRYRAHVDRAMHDFLRSLKGDDWERAAGVIELGLNHEQQHQELILTDLKHAFSINPLRPAYREPVASLDKPAPLKWVSFPAGVVWIGHSGTGFAFDNESPRHRVFQEKFRLASRLVTNDEYLRFMADNGYERPELWLSDGWAARQSNGWNAPLYWDQEGEEWMAMTLSGLEPLAAGAPVCHLSFYEADAFARWAGSRLPTEPEWEAAAATSAITGRFLDSGRMHPAEGAAPDDLGPIYQFFGEVWQWTSSPYSAYPGYAPAAGALGEYNAKFMCNQMVLRGASCVTPRSHARTSYRNFFPPDARWQFTGLRLAQDQ